MAVRLFTAEANALLTSIKRGIEKGEIETWSIDSDGDFTHTASGGQWKNRAYLRPKVMDDRLLLNVIIRKTETQKREVYAVYHGRFIEMVISHFPKLFSTAVATPSYTKEDSELNS
jgi:hypothetical protein